MNLHDERTLSLGSHNPLYGLILIKLEQGVVQDQNNTNELNTGGDGRKVVGIAGAFLTQLGRREAITRTCSVNIQ